MTALPALRLNKNEDRRLRAGHVWVFSNEVDTKLTPLTQFEPGQAVLIESAGGQVIGSGYVNPHALICARLVSRDPKYILDQSLLAHRLNIALSLRERLFDTPVLPPRLRRQRRSAGAGGGPLRGYPGGADHHRRHGKTENRDRGGAAKGRPPERHPVPQRYFHPRAWKA